jgi:Rrf2 family protein
MRLNAATNGAMRILMACRRDRLLSMPDMAQKLGLGEAMVLKTCQELMQAGFIAGRRGRGGGYRLARSPDKVTVMEIVDLFEPEENLFPCRLHISGECRIVTVCKLRNACESAYAAFRAELNTLTLADLSLGDIQD